MSAYLIWSNYHRSWWRPNSAGYTGDVWAAGRYDKADAEEACRGRTWETGEPTEVIVLAPEAGRTDLFSVEDIRGVPALMARRVDDATRAVRLDATAEEASR